MAEYRNRGEVNISDHSRQLSARTSSPSATCTAEHQSPSEVGGGGGGWLVHKALYRETTPRGPTLYHFLYHF